MGYTDSHKQYFKIKTHPFNGVKHWRVLRQAIPTGKSAGKLSKHIKQQCTSCINIENDMHILFLWPLSKVAWFSHPWYLNTKNLTLQNHTAPQMIHASLNYNHQEANLANVYTILWCVWKAKNNVLFNRRQGREPIRFMKRLEQ